MYMPPAFRISDQARLHTLMRNYPFAVLVSNGVNGLQTTHLPFMLDCERGKHGTLLGHMARANSHWRYFDGAQEAAAIFTGPHAYVSPSWYTSPRSVPTWNYAVVHAHGCPRIVVDETRVRSVLEDLVTEHEEPLDTRWTMQQAASEVAKLFDHIVVFEMEVSRLEGKFKLSQNRSRADQQGVVQALADSDDLLRRATAGAMRAWMAEDPNKT